MFICLVEAARRHEQAGSDVAREPTRFARVETLECDAGAKRKHSGNGAAVEADLKGVRALEFGKKLHQAWVGHVEHVLARAQTNGFVQ